VRYLLPVYPFLFILLAAVVMQKPKVWLIAAVVAIQFFETVRIYPDYLAFFNTVSGGPGNGRATWPIRTSTGGRMSRS